MVQIILHSHNIISSVDSDVFSQLSYLFYNLMGWYWPVFLVIRLALHLKIIRQFILKRTQKTANCETAADTFHTILR